MGGSMKKYKEAFDYESFNLKHNGTMKEIKPGIYLVKSQIGNQRLFDDKKDALEWKKSKMNRHKAYSTGSDIYATIEGIRVRNLYLNDFDSKKFQDVNKAIEYGTKKKH